MKKMWVNGGEGEEWCLSSKTVVAQRLAQYWSAWGRKGVMECLNPCLAKPVQRIEF